MGLNQSIETPRFPVNNNFLFFFSQIFTRNIFSLRYLPGTYFRVSLQIQMILNINYYVNNNYNNNNCLTLFNVHYDTLQVFIFFFKEVRRNLSDSPFVSSLLLLSENGLNEEIFRVKTFFCYKYCLLTYS